MAALKEMWGRNRGRLLLPMVLALAALVSGAGRSEASLEKLREDMGKFAGKLKGWLHDQGESGIVAMTSFQNLPEFGTNPSHGLSYILTQELKKAEVPVLRKANYGINGKVSRYPEKGDLQEIKYLTVTLELTGAGKVVLERNLKIEDKEAIDLITGYDRVEVKGNRFFKGPCGVEILVGGKPCKAELVEKMPFVVLNPDEEYTIRLINEFPQETAVWVGIDGLSMFAFSEDREPDGTWRDYRVLVPAKDDRKGAGEVPLAGWYFHNREGGSRKFRVVTEYPESAAYLKGLSSGQLGMITLQFWETWPKGTRPGGVGTGVGAAFTQKWTKVERDLGKLKATITIRYDKK